MVWQPNWTIAPGELLAEELAERGLSERVAAKALGIPASTLGDLLAGDAALTEDIAHRLSAVLGTSATLWLNLERFYRDALARGLARLVDATDERIAGPIYSGKAS